MKSGNSFKQRHRSPLHRGLLFLAIMSIALDAYGVGIPEHVALVVNGDSWVSRYVANEYRFARQIPTGHIIEIHGLTNFEQVGIDEFRDRILRPALAALEERGLSPQIDYLLYSADLPTAIQVQSDIGDQRLPRVLTPVASINGLTYMHRLVLKKDLRYLDLNANLYARRILAKSADTSWTVAEQDRYAQTMQRLQEQARERRRAPPKEANDKKELEKNRDAKREDDAAQENAKRQAEALTDALDSLRQLQTSHPRSSELLYNIACALALLNREEEALQTLSAAADAGWANYQLVERDSDLVSLRGKDGFKSLVDRMKMAPLEIQPTTGFRSQVAWTLSGEPTTEMQENSDRRYLLSTVLACTQGRGMTPGEAIEHLRRSIAADGSRPKGTIYFEHNGDIRSTTREWAFRTAAARLQSHGVQAAVEPGILPQGKSDVAGAVIGVADFDWKKSGSAILPGAIVEHLTSFGGVLTKGAGQTPLVEFLRHGAAGSSGTVTEPFAIQAKFPSPFIQVHYVEGCTLAESFYQSVTGPYQLLIVGDALCRPWGRHLEVVAEELPNSDAANSGVIAKLSGVQAIKPRTTSRDGIDVSQFQLFVDGRLFQTIVSGKSFSMDSGTIDDGHHELSLVAIGNDPTRTTGRRSYWVHIQNSSRSISVQCDAVDRQPWEKPFTLHLSAPLARSIEVKSGPRVLGRVAGESGDVQVDPKSLGPGPVRLDAFAQFAGSTVVRAQPLDIRIAEPVMPEPIRPP